MALKRYFLKKITVTIKGGMGERRKGLLVLQTCTSKQVSNITSSFENFWATAKAASKMFQVNFATSPPLKTEILKLVKIP